MCLCVCVCVLVRLWVTDVIICLGDDSYGWLDAHMMLENSVEQQFPLSLHLFEELSVKHALLEIL